MNRAAKREVTQSGIAGKPAFTGSGFVRLLRGPNGPAAHRFQNRGVINLDISPFKNGRLDQRGESGNVKDLAEWKVIGVSVDQDVGRGEFRHDWDAVRDERKINQVALIEEVCERCSPDVGI